MKAFVHFSRLIRGRGDIADAYSADVLSGDSDAKRTISVFQHEGKLWTTGGTTSSFFRWEADGYELIAPEDFTHADSAPYSYQGRTVKYKGRTYRLGPRVEFHSVDSSVSEWCDYLRRTYRDGGYFTSGKTYHELLREISDKTIWDIPSRSYVPPSGNVVLAIQSELECPDFDKWKAATEPEPEPEPSAQLCLSSLPPLPYKPASVPAWRKAFSR
ncbi:MAG TPA: hypothetical protein VK742_01150 [Candidatus Sulfotelmatobacter sp.]|jgi:hypothetical protein|nr:hypothetical protein [Candidatus Sulfotelmatobacter sp.]